MNKLEVNKWLKGLIYKKDSAKRPASDKFLKRRACQISRNPKYDRHQKQIMSKSKCQWRANPGIELTSYKKLKSRRFYARFKDNAR